MLNTHVLGYIFNPANLAPIIICGLSFLFLCWAIHASSHLDIILKKSNGLLNVTNDHYDKHRKQRGKSNTN